MIRSGYKEVDIRTYLREELPVKITGVKYYEGWPGSKFEPPEPDDVDVYEAVFLDSGDELTKKEIEELNSDNWEEVRSEFDRLVREGKVR